VIVNYEIEVIRHYRIIYVSILSEFQGSGALAF